jgi:hypothetical protein
MVLLALTAIAPLWDAGRRRNFACLRIFLGGECDGEALSCGFI